MWMPLLLVLSMLSLSMGIELQSPGSADNGGKLILITVTQELVEGKYYSRDLGGIHFISQDGGVAITILGEGDLEEPLFTAFRPAGPNTASIASILGHQFLLLNTSTEGLVDYLIPPSMSARARKAANSHNPRKLERLLPKLSRDTSSNRENAFEELLSRREVQLIIAAAVAMGNEGITGAQYPAALPFYMIALRFAGRSPGSEIEFPSARSKRIVWPWQRTERCRNGYNCPRGRCPQDRSYNPCFGMCGDQCNCWWWVCLDCCWHPGCAAHDQWCYDYGVDSWVCWLTALVALIC